MKNILFACLLALSAAGLVRADEKPAQPAGPALLPGGVDEKRFKEILEGLGYDVKVSPGKTTFLAIQAGSTVQFQASFALSPSRNVIWVHVLVHKGKALPADVAEKMLAFNDKNSPYQFRRNGELTYLSGLEVNRDFTAKSARTMIENLEHHIKATEELWNEKKWAVAPPAAEPK